MTVIDYHDTRGLKEGIVSFVIICGRTIFASGHLVEIRSAAEILATLDGHAALDRMPFMPEMIPHTRRRYRVSRRVDKICDTIASTGSRRTHATVYLENLRCDGSGHDGCQAGCNLYRTEAWLRRVDDDLCHPAETLTHARMLRVRAGLLYPIGPPDIFAMTVPAGPRAPQRLVLVSVAVDASNGSAAKLENLAQAGRGRCVRSEATGPRFWRC